MVLALPEGGRHSHHARHQHRHHRRGGALLRAVDLRSVCLCALHDGDCLARTKYFAEQVSPVRGAVSYIDCHRAGYRRIRHHGRVGG